MSLARVTTITRLAMHRVFPTAIAITCLYGCQPSLDGNGAEVADADADADADAGPGAATSPPKGRSPARGSQAEAHWPEGHRRMVALLAKIAKMAPRDHPYLGVIKVHELKHRLAASEAASAEVRFRLNLRIGEAELRLGNLSSSIKHLQYAHELSGRARINTKMVNYARFRLGVAYMRLGETQNCCLRNTPESCIVPIRGGGLHAKREGSQKAIHYFSEILDGKVRDQNIDLVSRWLLNIAYMTLDAYPEGVPERHRVPEKVFASDVEFPRFENIAARLGLNSFNLCGGAIVDDFDNDHHLDIVTSTWDPNGQLRYFNNNGDGTFTERTAEAGLVGIFGGLNMVQADYDNDSDIDFLVLRGAWLDSRGRHPNSLMRNNGDGTFSDVSFAAGLGDVHYPTQTASWADYDNDGDVDLYIGNEHSDGLRAPSQLFRNNGDGSFIDVVAEAGVENLEYTKSVVWGDFNDDRLPDIYVSNYFAPNRVYKNSGDGTFTDVATSLGLTRPHGSFPAWFWDFDNDGVLDIYVSSYTGRVDIICAYSLGKDVEFEPSCLYRGDGRGGFTEVAKSANLGEPISPMGSNFGDIDNDGYLDFYLGTGEPSFESLMPNLMFVNREGKRFDNVTMVGGFGHLQKGHGVAFADLDNDGDSDIFEQMGGAFRGDEYGDALYENPGFGNHWLSIKLVGVQSNRCAIGARICVAVVEDGKDRSIYRHVNSGGSFGCNPLRQTIGLGKASAVRSLEVFWPTTGKTQTFGDVAVDQVFRIVEGEERHTPIELQRFQLRDATKSRAGPALPAALRSARVSDPL